MSACQCGVGMCVSCQQKLWSEIGRLVPSKSSGQLAPPSFSLLFLSLAPSHNIYRLALSQKAHDEAQQHVAAEHEAAAAGPLPLLQAQALGGRDPALLASERAEAAASHKEYHILISLQSFCWQLTHIPTLD